MRIGGRQYGVFRRVIRWCGLGCGMAGSRQLAGIADDPCTGCIGRERTDGFGVLDRKS